MSVLFIAESNSGLTLRFTKCHFFSLSEQQMRHKNINRASLIRQKVKGQT